MKVDKNISILLATLLGANIYADANLDTIVVSATKIEQSIKDTTSNVEIITAEEIEEKHLTTIAEVLNLVSGISITNNGGIGQTSSIKLRGFDNQKILVLINGIRYNDNTSIGGASFENLMATNIERVEIIKGSQSGIWGADATAGVINIITKKIKKGFHSSLITEYGSFKTKKYGLNTSYKTDNYYISLNSNIIDTDGFTAQAPKGDDINKYEDDGYKNKTSNIALGYKINSSNKIDLSHTIINSKVQFDTYNPTTFLPDPNGIDSSTTKNRFSQINYQNKNIFGNIDISIKKSVFNRNYSFAKYDGEIKEYGLKYHIPYNQSFLVNDLIFLLSRLDGRFSGAL